MGLIRTCKGIWFTLKFNYVAGNPLYDSLEEGVWKVEAVKRLPNLKKLDGETVLREETEWIMLSEKYCRILIIKS